MFDIEAYKKDVVEKVEKKFGEIVKKAYREEKTAGVKSSIRYMISEINSVIECSLYKYEYDIAMDEAPTPVEFAEEMNNLIDELMNKLRSKYCVFFNCKLMKSPIRAYEKIYWKNTERNEYISKRNDCIYRAIDLLCKDMKIASVYTTNEDIRQYCIDNNISMTDKPHRGEAEEGLGIVTNYNLKYERNKYRIGEGSAYIKDYYSLHWLVGALMSIRIHDGYWIPDRKRELKKYISNLDKLLTWIEQDKEEIMRIAA